MLRIKIILQPSSRFERHILQCFHKFAVFGVNCVPLLLLTNFLQPSVQHWPKFHIHIIDPLQLQENCGNVYIRHSDFVVAKKFRTMAEIFLLGRFQDVHNLSRCCANRGIRFFRTTKELWVDKLVTDDTKQSIMILNIDTIN